MIRFDANESLADATARNVRDALMEDLGRADWTGLLVPAGRRVRAQVQAKEAAVLCGQAWFDACVHSLDAAARVEWLAAEGAAAAAGSSMPVQSARPTSSISASRTLRALAWARLSLSSKWIIAVRTLQSAKRVFQHPPLRARGRQRE